MAEYEATAEGASMSSDDDKEPLSERSKGWMTASLKRAVLFISFGPGVLGFLWLIGRILKR